MMSKTTKPKQEWLEKCRWCIVHEIIQRDQARISLQGMLSTVRYQRKTALYNDEEIWIEVRGDLKSILMRHGSRNGYLHISSSIWSRRVEMLNSWPSSQEWWRGEIKSWSGVTEWRSPGFEWIPTRIGKWCWTSWSLVLDRPALRICWELRIWSIWRLGVWFDTSVSDLGLIIKSWSEPDEVDRLGDDLWGEDRWNVQVGEIVQGNIFLIDDHLRLIPYPRLIKAVNFTLRVKAFMRSGGTWIIGTYRSTTTTACVGWTQEWGCLTSEGDPRERETLNDLRYAPWKRNRPSSWSSNGCRRAMLKMRFFICEEWDGWLRTSFKGYRKVLDQRSRSDSCTNPDDDDDT